jgi:hypothetical protein
MESQAGPHDRKTPKNNETPRGAGFRRGGCARPDLFSGYRGCEVRQTPAVPEDTSNMRPTDDDVKGVHSGRQIAPSKPLNV